MNLPTEDVLLFGSLAMVAIGSALAVGSITGRGLLAFGVALIVFGIPAFVITFIAAAEEPK